MSNHTRIAELIFEETEKKGKFRLSPPALEEFANKLLNEFVLAFYVRVNGKGIASFNTVNESVAYAWGLVNGPKTKRYDLVTVAEWTGKKRTLFHHVVNS
tara:strand:+ start:238 stop:537 length:300 start_codon:yes stop_codon:yes gene_type:complete